MTEQEKQERMAEKIKTAEMEIDQLPGTFYCELPYGAIVAFEEEPSHDIWPRQLTRLNAIQAVAGDSLAWGVMALTHDEGYQSMMDDGIKSELQLLQALMLSDEDALDNLNELLSSLNTETGSAWVACQDNDPRWAIEEETGKVLTCDDKGVFHIN